MPVFHRIEMNVIDGAIEVPLVANCVLPIAALPDSLFALRDLARRALFVGRERTCKAVLESAANARKSSHRGQAATRRHACAPAECKSQLSRTVTVFRRTCRPAASSRCGAPGDRLSGRQAQP